LSLTCAASSKTSSSDASSASERRRRRPSRAATISSGMESYRSSLSRIRRWRRRGAAASRSTTAWKTDASRWPVTRRCSPMPYDASGSRTVEGRAQTTARWSSPIWRTSRSTFLSPRNRT